eukprot:TRINITY_DN4503_c0_g1_i1.p1 TRINITY_DN4503_c0_g1~~TRINITY_DN4503_c0_g1_i1.p1  ORF type:complete len:571 (-),score=136.16 TRINITY_DN4503_c0_g1_i1:238-1950(-)
MNRGCSVISLASQRGPRLLPRNSIYAFCSKKSFGSLIQKSCANNSVLWRNCYSSPPITLIPSSKRSFSSDTLSEYRAMEHEMISLGQASKFQAMEELYQKLESKFPDPDFLNRMISVRLNLLRRANLMTICKSIFEDYKKKGYPPDETIYLTMIKVYGTSGNVGAMNKVYEEMKSKGLKPDEFTFNVMMEYYGKNEDFDAQRKLLAEMRQFKIEPDVVTFTTIIASIGVKRDVSQVITLYDRMRELNIKPNEFLFNAMFKLFAAKGDVQNLMKFLREQFELGIPLQVRVVSEIRKTLAAAGTDKAAQFSQAMLALPEQLKTSTNVESTAKARQGLLSVFGGMMIAEVRPEMQKKLFAAMQKMVADLTPEERAAISPTYGHVLQEMLPRELPLDSLMVVWNTLKSVQKVTRNDYHHIITSLAKRGETAALSLFAKECFDNRADIKPDVNLITDVIKSAGIHKLGDTLDQSILEAEKLSNAERNRPLLQSAAVRSLAALGRLDKAVEILKNETFGPINGEGLLWFASGFASKVPPEFTSQMYDIKDRLLRKKGDPKELLQEAKELLRKLPSK